MPYIKLRTYWYDFRGIDNNFKMYSKAQYIVLDSVNMFSDVYESTSSLIMQSYCIDIHTKEHDTKVLYYFNKAEAEDALSQLITAITNNKSVAVNTTTRTVGSPQIDPDFPKTHEIVI